MRLVFVAILGLHLLTAVNCQVRHNDVTESFIDPPRSQDFRNMSLDERQEVVWNLAIPVLRGVINLVGVNDNYIIRLHDNTHINTFRRHLLWIQSQLGATLPFGKILHKYDFGDGFFRGYSGQLNPIVAQTLRTFSIVHSIERDQEASLNQDETTVTQQNSGWNLERISRSTATISTPPYEYQYYSRAGQGTDVYILDSGITKDHVDFSGRVVDGINVSGEPTMADATKHGTHVAGICCGVKYGIAKKAAIINVKVLNSTGKGHFSGIILALSWVINRAKETKRPSVVNLSVSGGISPALNAAIKATVDQGVHVVVAAGNARADACQFSPSSSALMTKGVMVVGSMNEKGRYSSFSNDGPCVNILAPGEFISSALFNTASGSIIMSGTSMASPHVTGASAAILSQVGMSPESLVRFIVKSSTRGAVLVSRLNTTSNLLWLNPSKMTATNTL